MSSPAVRPLPGSAGPLPRQEQGVLVDDAHDASLLDRSVDLVAAALRVGDRGDRTFVLGAAAALQDAAAAQPGTVDAGRRARRVGDARAALADAVDDLAAVVRLWADAPGSALDVPTAALRDLLDRVASRDAALRRVTVGR
ncbi:MAG: hypothetical protein M0P31_18285 [Solirubrobacteraceae bacterium]|nr:hypothetical protein [Solirubrobacteraceae bacterium]